MRWPAFDWRRLASLRVRLALWNTLAVLAMAVASLLAARLVARATLYDDLDGELRAGAQEVALGIQELYPDIDAAVAMIKRKARSQEERGWFIHLVTDDGTTIWRSEHCPDAVANFPPFNLDREENIAQVGPFRYVRRRIAGPNGPAYHARVGTYTSGLDEQLTSLVRALLAVGFVLCTLTPLVGWWLARRATRPVAAVLAAAEGLQPARLADRLPIRGTGDELDHLATTINRLLDEVAGHVDRQQRFVADAAHELRGPLAAVSTALEVAIAQPRAAEDYRETLTDVLGETRHLAKITNDLLTLAEAGRDEDQPASEPVDLEAVARQAAGMFTAVAEDRGIGIMVDAVPAPVSGNASQLRRLLANLLDNAIRFTPRGGGVRIRVRTDRDAAVLTVSDSGPGIAPEHLARIFDRFYKADTARPRDDGRSGGLGLPICKAIAERHGGTITITGDPGTTVVVRLPLRVGMAVTAR